MLNTDSNIVSNTFVTNSSNNDVIVNPNNVNKNEFDIDELFNIAEKIENDNGKTTPINTNNVN